MASKNKVDRCLDGVVTAINAVHRGPTHMAKMTRYSPALQKSLNARCIVFAPIDHLVFALADFLRALCWDKVDLISLNRPRSLLFRCLVGEDCRVPFLDFRDRSISSGYCLLCLGGLCILRSRRDSQDVACSGISGICNPN